MSNEEDSAADRYHAHAVNCDDCRGPYGHCSEGLRLLRDQEEKAPSPSRKAILKDRQITTGESPRPASASGSEIESARIAEIRERRAKITKPPWKAYHRVSPRGAHQQWHIGNEDGLCQITMHGYERDYNFIANAPADIDFLLSEVERLSALIPSNEQEKT